MLLLFLYPALGSIDFLLEHAKMQMIVTRGRRVTMKQNLHTHTVYCDGSNTPEEILEAAIAKGFDSIGFSGHSYMYFSDCIANRTQEYIAHINRLKKEYEGRIKVFLGLEVDMYSIVDAAPFDYLIGSVHFPKVGEEFLDMDRDAHTVRGLIDQYFGGDGLAYAKAYYDTLAQLPDHGKFDIVGHFDLLAKHRETVQFFDEDSRQYRNYAVGAAEALAGKVPFFEVNSGAIARGYRTTPYPNPFIIKELKRLGFGAVITSDCHDCTKLDLYFDEAAQLLRECGYKERFVLTDHGFIPVPL